MNFKNISAKTAAIALPFALAATAGAQATMSPLETPTLSYSRANDAGTWHNVMIISAVVLFAGLLDGDSTLTALGGAGVILSLVETNGNSFAYRSVPALDFAHFGRYSIGVSPFDSTRYSQGQIVARPSLVFQTKIRF